MSRTYKTRPLQVRSADPTDKAVGLVESHDHTNNQTCSLPDTPKSQLQLKSTGYNLLNCYYSWSYQGHQLCGCAMCTDRWGKKKKRKARRVESNKLSSSKEMD